MKPSAPQMGPLLGDYAPFGLKPRDPTVFVCVTANTCRGSICGADQQKEKHMRHDRLPTTIKAEPGLYLAINKETMRTVHYVAKHSGTGPLRTHCKVAPAEDLITIPWAEYLRHNRITEEGSSRMRMCPNCEAILAKQVAKKAR